MLGSLALALVVVGDDDAESVTTGGEALFDFLLPAIVGC